MLRYILEQTHGHIQQIIIDPEGEFASLREHYDYLLAAKDGDVPADVRSAKLLARRLMEVGASAVIDLYELKLPDRRRFLRLFLEELMHLPRVLWRPLIVVIDEAHNFCPERGSGESESTDSVITLCTQGRKRGYCAVLATQRISKLHKDAAAELLNKLIGRTALDIDVKRAGDELGFDKDSRLTLRDLPPGEFYAFGPAISNAVTPVRSGPVITTHPEAGDVAPPAPPAPAAIQKLLKQLQDLPKQAEDEARSLDDLRRVNSGLQRKLRQAEKGSGQPVLQVDEKATDRAVKAATRELQDQLDGLLSARDHAERRMQKDFASFNAQLEKRFARLRSVTQQLTGILEEPAPLIKFGFVDSNGTTVGNGAHTPTVDRAKPARTEARSTRAPVRIIPPRSAAVAGTLPKGEYAVLTAACQYPDGVTREQITILTGYKRSTRDAYIQRLRERGLVDVQGGNVLAAEGAEEQLGDFEPLPTGDALRDYWLERLPVGEAALLAELIEAFPSAVGRDQISEVTGYKRSTRDAYIQRMKARQIIEISSEGVKAAPFLFD